MREDWIKTTIDSSCIINYGTRVVRSRDGGSIYDVYGGGGATFKMDSYNREDCMVIARFAMSPQCTRFVSGKFYLNDSGLTLSAKDTTALSQAFLDKVILAYNDKIYACGRGSAQKNLRVDEFKELAFGYPKSLSEQQRIVDFLDAEFEKIDQIKANADAQLQAAKDLFQAALKQLLTPKEGWEEKTIDSCVSKLVDGSHNPPKGVAQSQYKMLSSKNIGNDQLQDINEVRYLSETDFVTENKRTRAQANDVALTIVGTIGRSYVLTEKDLPITFQRSVAVMTPNDFIYPRFLMYSLIAINDELNTKAHGAAQKGIYLNQLKKVTITFPTLAEQQQIARQLDAISEKVQLLQQNYDKTITLCNDLKQALLKSIFA